MTADVPRASEAGSTFDSGIVPAPDRPPRVLVAEGDPVRRAALVTLARQEGAEARELGRALEVPQVVEDFEPDLLLLSTGLSDRSGVDLCRTLRASPAGEYIAIILLSSDFTDEDSVARGLLAGADDYVTQPHRLVELRARVRVQLRGMRAREALGRVRVERDALRREARNDALTGVPNRRSVESALFRHMALGEAFAVLFVDIDKFKSVNDTLGHDVGDVVLCATALRLQRGIRGGDMCGRLGGEEFCVIAAGVGPDIAMAVAERHRKNVEAQHIPQLGERHHVTISVGVAAFDPVRPDASPDALLRRADEALYEAKNTGRNKCVLATPAPEPRATVQPPPSLETPPVSVPISRKIDSKEPVSESSLDRALERALSTSKVGIPILPDVAAQAVKLASDPNADVGKLAQLVERSPAIAGRFLALANSALYARGAKVTAARAAIVRMGMNGARDLLFHIACEPSAGGARHRAQIVRSFQRSVVAATAARAVCWELRERYDNAYLYGLLHDIGESRVWRVLAELPPHAGGDAELADLVRRHHAQVGADIVRDWALPPDIVDACSLHHDDEATVPLHVRVVMIADTLVDVACAPADTGVSARELAKLQRLGLPQAKALQLIDTTREAAQELSKIAS